jgi:hypothetical protein
MYFRSWWEAFLMQIDPAMSGAVQAVNGASPTTMASPPPTYMSGVLSSIAGQLGLSTETLRTQLQAGSSLTSIASNQGVARSDLVSFVAQQAQSRRSQQGLAPIDQTTLDRVINRAVDRGRPSNATGSITGTTPSVTATVTDPTTGIDGLDIQA